MSKKDPPYATSLRLTALYSLLGLAIAYLLLGEWFFELGDMQLDRSGDGFKNYFSFAYQYRYGSGLWFDAMQYPYGDLLSYADGQPTLYLLFKFFKLLGIDLTGHELFIVQFMPVLGLFIASLLLHAIFKEYKLSMPWTILSVAACLALSPQLFRFNSHYALAYTFCFPSVLLLCIKYQKEKISAWVFIFGFSLINLIFAFIHPYHLLISAVFVLSLALSSSIYYKKISWAYLAAAILPVIVFLFINGIMDPYNDRPQNPYGVSSYKTEFSDLIPFYGWIYFFQDILPGLRDNYTEGYCYSGILFIFSPLILFFALSKKTKVPVSKGLLINASAAILCLLFAMGIHLILTDQKILEILPGLRQFRSLGRFSWPFYYISFISLSVITYHLCVNNLNKRIAASILSLIALLWFADAYAYTQRFQDHVRPYTDRNLLSEDRTIEEQLRKKAYKADDFQAVLPVPVPTEGAEKFNPYDNWNVKMKMIPFVFQHGIPMIGCYMSRTSHSRILKQSQLGSSAYIKKKLIGDLTEDKALLMLMAKEDSIYYPDLLAISERISMTSDLILASIAPEDLYTQHYLPVIGDTVQNSEIYYNGFDDLNEKGLYSPSAKRISDSCLLFEGPVDSGINKELTLSIWYRIETDDSGTPHFIIDSYDSMGTLLNTATYRDKDIKRFEVLDDWIQIKKTVSLDPSVSKIKWTMNATELLIDHALITGDSTNFLYGLENDFYIYQHYLALKDPSKQ